MLSLPIKLKNQAFNKTLIVFFSAVFMSLMQGKIFLPFSPVPLVTQNLFILLTAMTLGSRLGLHAILLFVAEALMGLPVLASHLTGLALLTGPTSGYVLGYVAGGYCSSGYYERSKKKPFNAVLALLLGTVLIHLLGSFHLSFFLGGKKALYLTLFTYLPADLLKIMIFYPVLKKIKRIL